MFVLNTVRKSAKCILFHNINYKFYHFRDLHFRHLNGTFNVRQKKLPLSNLKITKLCYSSINYTKNETEIENNSKIIDNYNEKSFLKLQTDPDTFGTLSSSHNRNNLLNANETIDEDEGDRMEREFQENPVDRSKRLTTKQYADMIKNHLKYKRIADAIDVVETRMIQQDHVQPQNYIFNLLIGGCARVGYTKKAFQIFTKMKQRGLKITGGTYTSLFNACANGPFPKAGLAQAHHLREIMFEKGVQPNTQNYNAMIKAFGRCGDIKTAFQLIDEMKDKQFIIKTETFNFALQACVTDQQYGFRHALLIWHKLLQLNLIPDIYSFNLLLRCVRDCEIGDLETLQQVIETILTERHNHGVTAQMNSNIKITDNTKKFQIKSENLTAETNTDKHIVKTDSELLPSSEILPDTPNLLTRHPHLGTLIELSAIRKPHDRLLLIGGVNGFFNEMDVAKVVPDIRTFTALLDVIPPTTVAEKKLIIIMKKQNVKADVDFFNILIKKRSMRFDYVGAKEVLSMIATANLTPDIVTYGVLSLGCETEHDANDLLQEMKSRGIRINIEILGAMLRNGTSKMNFQYIFKIMDIVTDKRIKPNERFLHHLNNFKIHCSRLINNNKNFKDDKEFKENVTNFKMKLEKWNKFMGLDKMQIEDAVKKVREHPWEQFKQKEVDGIEPINNAVKRRKEKRIKSIKKIEIRQNYNVEDFRDNT